MKTKRLVIIVLFALPLPLMALEAPPTPSQKSLDRPVRASKAFPREKITIPNPTPTFTTDQQKLVAEAKKLLPTEEKNIF